MLGSSLTTTTIPHPATILATQLSANADSQPTMPLPSSEGCGLVFVLINGGIRGEEDRGGIQDMGGPTWYVKTRATTFVVARVCPPSFHVPHLHVYTQHRRRGDLRG